MVPELKKLSTAELETLLKAPLLVSILIAGADGEIDRNEIKGAMETARKKAKGKSALHAYYTDVAQDFEDKLKILLPSYSSSPEQRGNQITDELVGLNAIFKKVEGNLAVEIYNSLKSLALTIAKSSGGIFGMKSIGAEEARFIDLNMIQSPDAR